jgi:apolipoprotein N-acyltransferase
VIDPHPVRTGLRFLSMGPFLHRIRRLVPRYRPRKRNAVGIDLIHVELRTTHRETRKRQDAPDAMTSTATPPCPTDIHAVVYRAHWRVVVSLLVSISGTSLLLILWSIWFSHEGPYNPLRLMRLVAGFCLLPGLTAAVLRRLFAATLHINADTLVIEQRHQRTAIPLHDIAAIKPWAVPLPGSGMSLVLDSEKRWDDGIELENPTEFLDALVNAGASQDLRSIAQHPGMIYADAKWTGRFRSARRWLFKFPIFALVPTLPLFRVHQLIAYGGVFGEYHQYGLKAYLLGFAIYWATLTIYLLLYAAALRAGLEIVTIATVVVAPAYAAAARRIAERICAVLFYGGVPIAVILRFMPW